MYAGHLGLPCFFIQLLQWQEYQVLPSVLMEVFSQAGVLTAQSFCGKLKSSTSNN